jgi:hypothetical protein
VAMGDGPVIPVIWLGGHPVSWDQAMLDDAFSGRMWPVGYEFRHYETKQGEQWPECDGAVVLVHGPMYASRVGLVNELLGRLGWALVCVTSDEERRFPVEQLDHPNMVVWLQYPREGDVADGFLPVGYPPHFRALLPERPPERTYDWVFAGQVNHKRRRECVEALRLHERQKRIRIEPSPGFTQGLGHQEYADLLSQAWVVACPSGPESVDSFRVWEALEACAVPLADCATPHGPADYLWIRILGTAPPFPLADWPMLSGFDDLWRLRITNRSVAAWWLGWKRQFCQRIGNTILDLSGDERAVQPVTVLIPTSPIAAHPDTAVIEETIASVRYWHPDAEIVVMCDGVRPEQEHYRERYSEYLERLVWLAARDGRILPVIHGEHLHQAEMTRRALDLVDSPLVLFVEHDTPLVTDEPIDWPAIEAAARTDVDLVRFHYEAMVHPEHEHLMLDTVPRDVRGAPLLRTVQWSQRPHLANTGWYRKLLADHFPPGYKGMVEDVMHGVVHNEWREFGLAGWDRYRLAMYAPGGNLKRSLHLDGRGADPKWSEG